MGVTNKRQRAAKSQAPPTVGANLPPAQLRKILATYKNLGALSLAPPIVAAIVGFPEIFKLDGLGDEKKLAGVVGNGCVTAISWQVNRLLANVHPLTGGHFNLDAVDNRELRAMVIQLATYRNQLIQLGACVGEALLSKGHLDAVKVSDDDAVFGTPTCVMVTAGELVRASTAHFVLLLACTRT